MRYKEKYAEINFIFETVNTFLKFEKKKDQNRRKHFIQIKLIVNSDKFYYVWLFFMFISVENVKCIFHIKNVL